MCEWCIDGSYKPRYPGPQLSHLVLDYYSLTLPKPQISPELSFDKLPVLPGLLWSDSTNSMFVCSRGTYLSSWTIAAVERILLVLFGLKVLMFYRIWKFVKQINIGLFLDNLLKHAFKRTALTLMKCNHGCIKRVLVSPISE